MISYYDLKFFFSSHEKQESEEVVQLQEGKLKKIYLHLFIVHLYAWCEFVKKDDDDDIGRFLVPFSAEGVGVEEQTAVTIASVQQAAAFADHNVQYQFRTENSGGQVSVNFNLSSLGDVEHPGFKLG